MPSMNGRRARRVLSPRMPRVMGRFMSSKGSRSIHWESQLEEDFCYLLEWDLNVIEFREQPETVFVHYAGKRRRYTPDFLVHRHDGKFIFEVKPLRKALSAKLQDLFEAANDLFTERGFRYDVVTEGEVRREPLLSNIKMLLRYSLAPFTDQEVMNALLWLQDHGPVPIREFAEIGAGEHGLSLVYALIRHNNIRAPIHSEIITPDTEVSA